MVVSILLLWYDDIIVHMPEKNVTNHEQETNKSHTTEMKEHQLILKIQFMISWYVIKVWFEVQNHVRLKGNSKRVDHEYKERAENVKVTSV